MSLIEPIRKQVRTRIRHVARFLDAASGGRLHPDAVTMIGFLAHIPIALLIGSGRWPVLAALLLLVFGLFDTLDGELARLQGRVTNTGGLLDAATDRMKEVVLYTGATYYFALGPHPAAAAWAAAACGASLCVSYVKSKGETVVATSGKKHDYATLNKAFADGLVPFELRMLLLMVGLLAGQLLAAVVVITVLATFTAFQRLLLIRKALR